MTNREKQKENRKILILETALDLFIKKGYAATKIADIAHACNMSMGLLFHYFESKEVLYTELIKIGSSKLKINISNDITSPISFFKEMVDNFFNLIKNSPVGAKMFVLMENANHQDIISDELKELLLEARKLIDKSIPVIEKGQALNEIKEGNPKALAVTFWGAIQGVAQIIAIDGTTPFPESDWILSILRKQAM